MAAPGGSMGQAGLILVRALGNLSTHIPYHGFVPHPLSVDHFAANLPDYDVAELRHWMRLYFHKPTSVGYFVQSIIITVWLAIILFFGLVVILYRLWDRTLWLFRIQETRGSRLIIPNSITAFVLFEAAYSLVWTANVWNNLAIDKYDAEPLLTGFWNGTPWILLFSGAWCGAWGTFFASPGILHRSSRARGFDPRRLVPGPKLCNFIGFFAPFAFTATSLAVSIPTGLTYKNAVRKWKAWDAQAAAVSQSEYPVQGDLRAEAAEVWKGITDAWWWSSIGWLALLVFAWAFLLFYVMCGGFLVYTIHSQLQTMRIRRNEGANQGQDGPASGPDTAGPEAPRWDRQNAGEIAADLEMSRAQASTFFPPLATQGTATTGPTTRKSRIRMLSSAMTNVSFIYGAISLGTLGFVINLHWLLESQYQQAVIGPVETNRIYEKYMAVASWVISVFGLICFTAISQKTFEGVFEEWSANREAKKMAKNQSKHSDSSTTLMARNPSKTTSSVSMRLKSLKSTLVSPIASPPASRAPSVRTRKRFNSADVAMDPAHAQALQYFQRNRVAGLGLVAMGDGDDGAQVVEQGILSDGYAALGPQTAGPGGLSFQMPHATPDGTSSHHILALPFDHYRVSVDKTDAKVLAVAGNDGSIIPRMQPLPTPSGSLTPRRYGSASSGIIIQRAITSTSEDIRMYAGSGEGIERSISSGSGLRDKSKKESPSPRSDTRRTKFDAFQSEPVPPAVPAPALSASQRRREFHQDDSIAFTDSEDVLDEEIASSYLDSQSESGSVRHPLRPSRPCSSVLAVWPHENVNGSPTFGTAPLSPSERSPVAQDTPRMPDLPSSAHIPTAHTGVSQATLVDSYFRNTSADDNRESLEAAVRERKPSLRWDPRFDWDKSPKEGTGESSSSSKRTRKSSFGRDGGNGGGGRDAGPPSR
ncbi:hypothetical protein CF327_g1815 [Tilletia walkeri]|uniref:Uncharacterized protein n=1 Tax=Tilletia walkeri TaxID=117179 RepID=A0A8X7T970_9BASI|nr:hypothetical protein CF327_g1815 [Tilletia walkeri]KAE8272043.1 hypothetical protein A4X09_0g318 [Tilletia walkeri]